MGVEVIGFADPNSEGPQNDGDQVIKKKSNSKKSGGFQAMGLSFPVLKGVQKRGYKIPTPIQRKVMLWQVN